MTLLSLVRARPPASEAVARAIIDASCLSIVADDHVDPREVDYAIGVAQELLSRDRATAARAVEDALSRVRSGADATLARIARELVSEQQREVAYLAATGVIYRDEHLARREAKFLATLAGALGLSRAAVDRLSTTEPLELGAWYPLHWRRSLGEGSCNLQPKLEAWGRERGFLEGEKVTAVMKALDLDGFVRLVFPECTDEEALLVAAKYTAWLYLSDDALERLTAAGDPGAARAFIEPYLRTLATGSAPAGADSLAQAFAELTRELWERAARPDFRLKWEDSHREYWLEGTLRELTAAARTDSVSPLRHHLGTRPAASGVAIYFDMAEVLSGCVVPLGVRNDPRVRDLRRLGSLVGGIFNDVLSFDKEKPFENLANVALAIRRELGLDDRAALTYTASLHNALVGECDRQIAELLHVDPGFRAYSDSLRFSLHGLAAWQLRSHRYKNRHAVVISNGPDETPRIDPAQLDELCALAGARRHA